MCALSPCVSTNLESALFFFCFLFISEFFSDLSLLFFFPFSLYHTIYRFSFISLARSGVSRLSNSFSVHFLVFFSINVLFLKASFRLFLLCPFLQTRHFVQQSQFRPLFLPFTSPSVSTLQTPPSISFSFSHSFANLTENSAVVFFKAV